MDLMQYIRQQMQEPGGPDTSQFGGGQLFTPAAELWDRFGAQGFKGRGEQPPRWPGDMGWSTDAYLQHLSQLMAQKKLQIDPKILKQPIQDAKDTLFQSELQRMLYELIPPKEQYGPAKRLPPPPAPDTKFRDFSHGKSGVLPIW